MTSTKKREILVITQPLGTNYGGLMQAFALQKSLGALDHQVLTDLGTRGPSLHRKILSLLKQKARYALRRRPGYIVDLSGKEIITQNTQAFIQHHINTVDIFSNQSKPRRHTISNYDGFVVGSDQVWRKPYSHIPTYLLNFTKGRDVKRIAYAASFGRDDLTEYGARLIKKSAKLAKKFDAISVREDSGVAICKQHWGVNAKQLVDPTLLISKRDYAQLADNGKSTASGKVFVYVLDDSAERQAIIKKVAHNLKLKTSIFPMHKPTSKAAFTENPEKYIMPPVYDWLAGFKDAEFVVTDSFHGCVFSIIFNKPFIAIGNAGRGLTRFTSLLKIFGLENRLVSKPEDITDKLVHGKINWTKVNKVINSERKKSLDFLRTHLGPATDE